VLSENLMDASAYLWLTSRNWGSNCDYAQLNAMVELTAIHDESMKGTVEEKRSSDIMGHCRRL
jgi:hypothetical protein